MFKLKLFNKESELDMEIKSVLREMNHTDPSSDEYTKMADNLEKLLKAKSYDKKKISPDTLLVVSANLIGMLLILNYEKNDIITSKAFGYLLKGRV